MTNARNLSRVPNAVTTDSSGNLGLGVTPSAWSGAVGFQLLGGAVSSASVSNIHFTNNAYIGAGGWKYTNTNPAMRYSIGNGGYEWHTAPSGTAGNAISFTQAMTLDASGNLGIGITSPSGNGKLAVNGDIYLTYGQSIKSAAEATASYNTIVQNYYDNNGNDTLLLKPAGASGGGQIIFAGRTGTERMRIDSSGNLISSAPTTPPTLATNGTMVFNLTSNTNLRVSVRGSDGVTRVANITLA